MLRFYGGLVQSIREGHNIVTYEEALLQIVIKIYVTKRGELIPKQRQYTLMHSIDMYVP